MTDLQNRVAFAVMEGRAARVNALVGKQDAYDTRGEFSLVYDGYSNGSIGGDRPTGVEFQSRRLAPAQFDAVRYSWGYVGQGRVKQL